MRCLPLLILVAIGQISSSPLDVTAIAVGAPTRVADLDLGKLKGELRRLSWSPDGTKMCVQTADGDKPADKVHVYIVTVEGGGIADVDREPDWAWSYWAFKSDRYAPGLPLIEIAVEQKTENVKTGMGSAGGAERGSDPSGGGNLNGAENVQRAAESGEHENVVRLTVFGSVIGQFVNTRPLPGLTFGWGPERAAAIAFVDSEGRLYLLDSLGHKRAISGVKDALLPAWTTDGSRLAFLQKTGRRKYALMTISLAAGAR